MTDADFDRDRSEAVLPPLGEISNQVTDLGRGRAEVHGPCVVQPQRGGGREMCAGSHDPHYGLVGPACH